MSTKPESGLYRKVKKFVHEQGGLCFKIHGSPMQEKGQPDIIGWIPKPSPVKGHYFREIIVHFAVELKMPGKEADPSQEYQLNRWRDGGYKAGVAKTLEEFKEIVFGD